MSSRRELTRALERVEGAAWADFYRSCDEQVAADPGIRVVQLRSSLVTIAAAFDVLAFNRAIVTGLDAALDETELDAIPGVFRDAGLRRAFVQVNPGALDEDLAALADSRGLFRYNRWIEFWRPVDDVPDVMTDLEIVGIGPDRGAEFAAVAVSSFDWPAGMEGMIAGSVGRPGWMHYAALDGERIVATAAAFVHEGSSWLVLLPRSRRQGVGEPGALFSRDGSSTPDGADARGRSWRRASQGLTTSHSLTEM